jgi:glycine/D-amino acid oxidase-like deaminating enzyme
MTVAVLGAGLQGICASLALQERGHRIVLIEQDRDPMGRASLRNEGKIHLGFIYANDPSFRTAELMLTSAVQFAPLLDRWLPGCFRWNALRSTPFVYLVMRDSLIDPDALFAHYDKVAAGAALEAGSDYLGSPLGRVWQRIPVPSYAAADRVAAAIATEEVAIDVAEFRRMLCAALSSQPGIEGRFGWRVDGLHRCGEGFQVRAIDSNGVRQRLSADAVVNCLWDGRLATDRELGIVAGRQHVYRLKYRVLAELPPALGHIPALSFVLGQYGDVVPRPGGSYLSWYPACRRGWSSALSPPADWAAACRGDVERDVAADIASETLTGLDAVIPGMTSARVTAVDAGVVVAWGDRDIDRPDSELHERHAVGVLAQDGYFSIDTGKLTCAPYFADQLARLL